MKVLFYNTYILRYHTIGSTHFDLHVERSSSVLHSWISIVLLTLVGLKCLCQEWECKAFHFGECVFLRGAESLSHTVWRKNLYKLLIIEELSPSQPPGLFMNFHFYSYLHGFILKLTSTLQGQTQKQGSEVGVIREPQKRH